jgi:hypothetical protein
MKSNTTAPDYKGFRSPSEIISHAVWLYFRFSLSYRDVEVEVPKYWRCCTGEHWSKTETSQASSDLA